MTPFVALKARLRGRRLKLPVARREPAIDIERSARLHLEADRALGVAVLEQCLLEARQQLALLGGDAGIGGEQRPALVVERAGANAGAQPFGQLAANDLETGVRFADALAEAG
jgi:hypothetical protein